MKEGVGWWSVFEDGRGDKNLLIRNRNICITPSSQQFVNKQDTSAFEMDKKSWKKRENLYNLREIFAATTVGAISFPFALGFMQNLVFKPFRISCKRPNTVVSICGGVSIILSGIFASGAFVLSCESFKMSKLLSNSDKVAEKRFELEFNRSEEHVLIWGACSLAIFKIFGGKSRQVVPSHLYYPGAFAKMSVPAAGKSYAGSSAKRKLHILGECGGKFTPGMYWCMLWGCQHPI